MARQWVKLWTKTLLNPQVAELPDYLFRRWIEILMLAGMNDDDGKLQPVRNMAFILRLDETKLSENLTSLKQAGVVHQETDGSWIVTNWKKHQYSESIDRVRRHREKAKEAETDKNEERYGNGYSTVTSRVTRLSSTLLSSDSNSDSSILFRLYETEIGVISAMVSDKLLAAWDEYSHDWFEPAIAEAVRNNKRNWAYIEAILRRWKVEGFQSRKSQAASNGKQPKTTGAIARARARLETEGDA